MSALTYYHDATLSRTSEFEILIVEDNQAALCMLTDVLEDAGYIIKQAQDGKAALELVQKNLPDLILLDIYLPEMDGFSVCHQLKANLYSRHIPVIFCTALNDADYKIRGFKVGAVDFITKPYYPEEVLSRVSTHLELSRLRMSLEQQVAKRTEDLHNLANKLFNEAEVRRQVEQEMKLASKAFEASFSGIMVTDGNGTIVTVNPAFSRITGYTREEVIGQTPRFLKSGKHPQSFYQEIWRALEINNSWSGEIWNRCKDGNTIPMLENIYPVREKDGVVTNYVATFADLSESKDAQTLIDFLAYRDSLTGLANRLVARKHFEQAANIADTDSGKIAIISMDLDRFKVINESLGHAVGDQFLKLIAAKFSGCFGNEFLLCRDGGDEFQVVSPVMDDINPAIEHIEKIIKNIRSEIIVEDNALSVTTSIGMAVYPDHGLTFDELLQNANNALYSAKESGGNDYRIFTSEMNTEARYRLKLENSLRNAVTNNELQLVYQPKFCLRNEKITGVEALVRWNNPELGFVSPADFIPLAEETGMILSIDEWVINTAVKQLCNWQHAGFVDLAVSVNISALQFHRGDLSSAVKRALSNHEVTAASLDLEITEGVLMHNINQASPILEELKAIGVTISLDDFGTGYSSLSYLKTLPIDTLKIDKSFVDEIHVKSSDATIARAVISLGHNLGLNVVAEGVEYQEQYDFLREHECDQVQGYYLSRPVTAEEVEMLLRDQVSKDLMNTARKVL